MKVVVSLADAVNLGAANNAEVYATLSVGNEQIETRSTRLVNGHTPWPTTGWLFFFVDRFNFVCKRNFCFCLV
jgi:hypothetical protein